MPTAQVLVLIRNTSRSCLSASKQPTRGSPAHRPIRSDPAPLSTTKPALNKHIKPIIPPLIRQHRISLIRALQSPITLIIIVLHDVRQVLGVVLRLLAGGVAEADARAVRARDDDALVGLGPDVVGGAGLAGLVGGVPAEVLDAVVDGAFGGGGVVA